ncbi:uncharacterized protein [Battus philenor]|uniref:uncharacterized protein n=1 Tax=Battus philenor TaxID=42288 RepID=UPI0035CEF8F8
MTSPRETTDIIDVGQPVQEGADGTDQRESKDLSDLPPSGTSLHKRRRGEAPASLSVKSLQTNSENEGSSPCTGAPTSEDYWNSTDGVPDAEALCESMLQRLKDRDDPLSRRGKELAQRTKDTLEALDQLEKLLELLDQFVTLKEHNARILKRLRDVNHLKRLHDAHKRIEEESERLKEEGREVELINEALEAELECEYGQAIFDTMLAGGRGVKRGGSKWKGHARFGSSLLRKQRSRSAGGDDSDAPPATATPDTPLRRKSELIFSKEVEKSKVSKWTRVKAAFRWEKAQWSPAPYGGAAAVAAGALVGAVALAGSCPPNALTHPDPRDSASLTPGSALSLTPNSSCEELTMDAGSCRRGDAQDAAFLQLPVQDDSSTSPSPNKLHKSPWGKMRDIIQTHRESVKKKSRGPKSSPDVVPMRRRSLSDGGDSDAPPALTITIPSSEELESEPSHPVLRKQRSLELGARPPQHRPPRASKWTKVKRAFLTSASASVPSSPSRHSAFFTDAETEGVSSGCEASAVRDEIARDYAALQSRLRREFSDRRLHAGGGPPATRPVATEEQLSADFRKKLSEWQRMKGVRQPPPVPARRDLSDDFLKKWDEWKRMKETNSVPTWEEEAKPDEVLVQTSTGLFKFQGISRSFTRKLHEWEKSRGIAPEASTSALLREARARPAPPAAPLTRAQSDGSVAPTARRADRFLSDCERDHSPEGTEEGAEDGVEEGACEEGRGAVLVEVEAEEVCTAAPLMAVSPRHAPQKPVYTYGRAEARLLCETSSALTGTAVLQPNGSVVLSDSRSFKSKQLALQSKPAREQKIPENTSRRRISQQPSIEEDAMFIRKTIEEIERGSSSRFKDEVTASETEVKEPLSTSKASILKNKQDDYLKDVKNGKESNDEPKDDFKRRDGDKTNGKKKTKSRARLEREQSKPSASDSEQDVDTITVEIPRRRKRPRRTSERPRSPPTSLHSDSEGEVFVLKLKAPERREKSPEVIVKTTRKIFSPVVRSGESVPRAVIPVDVEDLAGVRPDLQRAGFRKKPEERRKKTVLNMRSKSSGDLQDGNHQKARSRPPLPTSPSAQRKPLVKDAAPSIRIMIQRYNKKINEEGPAAGSSAACPPQRSPSAERRRPPDLPVGLNIRNNPFLEREVQKSASACQLSRRDQTSAEKHLAPAAHTLDGVLKSHSAGALLSEQENESPAEEKKEGSQETLRLATASTDTVVPAPTDVSEPFPSVPDPHPVLRQLSDTLVPSLSRFLDKTGFYERSFSTGEPLCFAESNAAAAGLSERAARIRAARERFLASPPPMRREGTSSANDLSPGDRSSRVSCESDVAEAPGSSAQEQSLGRSASTGMVNVDREAWQRVAEASRGRARFSLARLAARLRRRGGGGGGGGGGAVSRLCRQSLLVQLRNNQ